MRLLLISLLLFASAAVMAAEAPMILVIALYNGPGIPEGWIDSTTREDATKICNELIANQSKEYANAISRSRCIIKVKE